jgi:hypothetical protein
MPIRFGLNYGKNLMTAALLKNRDYTIILAKVAPSVTKTPPGYENRWLAAQQAIMNLAAICESFDPDGINVYISCRDAECGFHPYRQVLSKELETIFQTHFPPENLHLLDGLKMALEDYFTRKAAQKTKPNGAIILVLIDGEPLDRMAIARLIVHATTQMEQDSELGIGFLQLGDDLIARGFLNALDENLQTAGAKFDIVHSRVLEEIPAQCLVDFLQDVIHD